MAAAGTTTALLVTGSADASDYKALPTCGKLAGALPGQPALTVVNDAPTQPPEHGLDPAFMDLQCATADMQGYVAVDIYQAGSLDLGTAVQYTDKAVHDGRSRAKAEFVRRSPGSKSLSADVRYSAAPTGNSICTVYSLKRNAVAVLGIPATGSLDQFEAACRQIAENQLPKVVGAALG